MIGHRGRFAWPTVAGVSMIAVMIGFGASGGATAQSAPLAQKAVDATALAATAQQKGKVRVIVMFAPPVAPNDMRHDAASIANVQAQVAAIQDAIIARHFGTANPSSGPSFERGLTRFSITPGFAISVTPAELEALAADSQVISIQEDRADPPTLLQSVPLIGMTAASASSATGASRAVAVLDTGVQSNHEFLTGKVVAEACFSNANGGGGNVSLCPNGTASQTGTGAADATTAQCVSGSNNICDHGTHVSGIAAGYNTSPSSGEPTNGVARSAKIVAVQVFTRFNSASDCNYSAPCVMSYTSDQMRALDWLYTNALTPATGITLASANMSLGGGYYTGNCDTYPVKPGIDNLRAAGVATVISSGNDGYTDGVGAPGCISTAVTVGSSTKADVISSFSNMSGVVDLMAPGSSILSSIPVPGSTASYASWNGTSMAAPHVAGAFAAIKTACPSATVSQIETALKNTGIAIADTRSGGTVSKPRIRVDLAITQLGCSTPTAVAHDFDGNGKSDLVWRNTGGSTSVWLMNGGAVSGSGSLGTVASAWSLRMTGDFNGDGKADLLWNHTSGATSVWFMNGASASSSASLGTYAGWTPQGTNAN
jgi:hypothetical protein